MSSESVQSNPQRVPQRIEVRRNDSLRPHPLQVVHCVLVAREPIQEIQIYQRYFSAATIFRIIVSTLSGSPVSR